MEHLVKSTWVKDMTFVVNTQGGEITLDAATEFGGNDAGLRSKPLMLASLVGCTGMDIASLIKKMHLSVDAIQIEATGELTEEHPKIYKKTHITFTFTGAHLNQEKLKKAVQLSFDVYCGVIAMFKSFSEVSFDIVFVEKG